MDPELVRLLQELQARGRPPGAPVLPQIGETPGGYQPPLTPSPGPTPPIPGVPQPPPPSGPPIQSVEGQAPPPPADVPVQPWELPNANAPTFEGVGRSVWDFLSTVGRTAGGQGPLPTTGPRPQLPPTGTGNGPGTNPSQVPRLEDATPQPPNMPPAVSAGELTGQPDSPAASASAAMRGVTQGVESAWDFIKRAWVDDALADAALDRTRRAAGDTSGRLVGGAVGRDMTVPGGSNPDLGRMMNDEARFAASNPPPSAADGRSAGATVGALAGNMPTRGPSGTAPLTEPPAGTVPVQTPGATGTPGARPPAVASPTGGGPRPSAPGAMPPAAPPAPGMPTPASPTPMAAAPAQGGGTRSQDLWRMLGIIGLSMMQPMRPGQNWLGHVGDALGAGLTYQLMQESAQQQGSIAQQKLDIEAKKAGASVAESGARVRRSDAELPADLALKAARIKAIDEQIASSRDETATRQLQRQRDTLSLQLESEFGRERAQQALALQRAQTQAAGVRGESAEMKAFQAAVTASKDPMTGRINYQNVDAIMRAQGVQPRLKPLNDASRAGAQRQLAAAGRPGSAEHEAMRSRLNNWAVQNGFYPEL